MKTIIFSVVVVMLFTAASCKQADKTNVSTKNSHPQQQLNIEADNKLLMVFETGDVSLLDSIIAPDFVNHAGAGDRIGLDSQRAMVKSFHASVNNVKMELKRQWSDSTHVVDWVRYTGTSPDVVIEGIEITSYTNGKAKEHWFFPSSRKN